MINYSLESNIAFIKTHLSIFNYSIHGGRSLKIPRLKQDIVDILGFGQVERRMRSYGWEGLLKEIFDLNLYRVDLVNRFGNTSSSISWGEKIGTALDSIPGFNDKFSE
jgi:hypothetical protein